jgi:hypothetical protein
MSENAESAAVASIMGIERGMLEQRERRPHSRHLRLSLG